MSQSLHVCEICGKKFATVQAVCGHLRIHSGLRRIWGRKESRFCSISTSAKETYIESETFHPYRRGHKATSSLSLKESSSLMTEIEKHEMSEAAMSLVMFSERVAVIRNLPPGDIAMGLELRSLQEKVIHCVESKQESSEVFSHPDAIEKSSTCSDAVAQALSYPLRSDLVTKRESNSSYKCKLCGKNFGRSQALGSHQRLHRSIKGQLAHKKEDFKGGSPLSVLTDSGAKKAVPQPSCFEVSQEELIELGDTNVKKHSAESKQEFSEVFSHWGSGKSRTCSDTVAQALPFPQRSKLQKKAESNSSYQCKICGKSFGCFQALGGHQRLRGSVSGGLACKRRTFEDGNSLYDSSEAKKIVSQLSSSEVSQEELTELRDTLLM